MECCEPSHRRNGVYAWRGKWRAPGFWLAHGRVGRRISNHHFGPLGADAGHSKKLSGRRDTRRYHTVAGMNDLTT